MGFRRFTKDETGYIQMLVSIRGTKLAHSWLMLAGKDLYSADIVRKLMVDVGDVLMIGDQGASSRVIMLHPILIAHEVRLPQVLILISILFRA